jgi:hypothetical protein
MQLSRNCQVKCSNKSCRSFSLCSGENEFGDRRGEMRPDEALNTPHSPATLGIIGGVYPNQFSTRWMVSFRGLFRLSGSVSMFDKDIG